MPGNPFVSTDSEACFNHFAPLVASIAADALETSNADADLVLHNLKRGVDAVTPQLAALVAGPLPKLDPDEILELPSLCLAFGFAQNKVFVPASPQEIRAHQASLRPSRRQTLQYLEVVAELGLVPADRVRDIRANSGALDEAHDAVAIAALFNEYASALQNKHPFPPEQLKQLAADGNWLVQQLTPKGAVPGKQARSPEAIARDQLWTELGRRYDLLFMAGVAIWGRRKVEEHVPPLHQRVPTPAKPKPAEAPAAPAAADPTKKNG